MKKYTYIFWALLPLIGGCDSFLDREYDSFISKERTYESYQWTSNTLTNAYHYLPSGLNRIWPDMLDAATDDAENSVLTSSIQTFNTGAWNAVNNPDDIWNQLYAGIRQCNEFIENVHNVNLERYRLDPDNQTEYENRVKDLEIWKHEAIFLRAFMHFELVKRYGPVPYLESVLPVTEDCSGVSRPDMDEVIGKIVADCDAAAEVLELTPWRDKASSYGRATKGAALALKSRVLLYAASPLYLDWQDLDETSLPSDWAKWRSAADAAKDVIDLEFYSLYGDYAALFHNNIDNNELIFQRRLGNSVDFEKVNSPVSYGGTGGTAPTLNLMEAYEMGDGTPFSFEGRKDNPFAGRDSRFYASFILNGDKWKDAVVETYEGGKDALPNLNATRTGFYLRKYMNESANVQTGGAESGHVWPYFRYAEICLNYAEALNECDPGNSEVSYYLDMVRQRAGQPKVPEDLSQDQMRERIRRERRVELAFEEHRGWDVRRWKIAGETLGAPVRGIVMTRKGSGYSYSAKIVEERSFEPKMYWYPIPQSEILQTGWEQNPKWD